MSSYVLLLRPGWDGVQIDSILDVSSAISDGSYDDWIAVAKVCDRIDGGNEAVKAQAQVLRDVNFFMLRARYSDCDGPFLLHCLGMEFTRDGLEQYLRDNPDVVRRMREEGRI